MEQNYAHDETWRLSTTYIGTLLAGKIWIPVIGNFNFLLMPMNFRETIFT